jgi:hypothetical protein
MRSYKKFVKILNFSEAVFVQFQQQIYFNLMHIYAQTLILL